MSIKKQVEDTFGLAAFRAALAPQEGSFHRAATLILNAPKDVAWKAARGGELNQKVAQGILDRNAKGQFVSAKDKPDALSNS